MKRAWNDVDRKVVWSIGVGLAAIGVVVIAELAGLDVIGLRGLAVLVLTAMLKDLAAYYRTSDTPTGFVLKPRAAEAEPDGKESFPGG